MAGVDRADCFSGAEHGRVVFRVGSSAAASLAVALVGGRRRVDDDFGAVGIRGGLSAFGFAEFGGPREAEAIDVDWRVRRGGHKCCAAVLQWTGERIARAVLDGRQPGARVSAEFESDGDLVPAATRYGVGYLGRRTHSGIGDATFAERTW